MNAMTYLPTEHDDAMPQRTPLARRYPFLSDLGRLALFGGIIWTVVSGLLVAAGVLPALILISIPVGTVLLIIYTKLITYPQHLPDPSSETDNPDGIV